MSGLKPRKAIPRSGPPNRRNGARQKVEFARTYHSKARVAFVQSLGCVYCTALSPIFGLATAGTSHNAHVGHEGAGAGRKANYDQITALCASHHWCYDERRPPLDDETVRAAIRSTMAEVERRWLAVCGEDGE